MARYIDADNLKSIIKKATDRMVYINGVKAVDMGAITGLIDRQPTADVVEVVRGCDCKYCETVIHSIIDEPQWFCTRMVKAFDVDPTCFCSYGERKG